MIDTMMAVDKRKQGTGRRGNLNGNGKKGEGKGTGGGKKV